MHEEGGVALDQTAPDFFGQFEVALLEFNKTFMMSVNVVCCSQLVGLYL